MTFKECSGAGEKLKWLLNYVFIDGMSGMALGLFATLIAGTILWQLGSLIDKAGNNPFGLALEAVGKVAQIAMGAGIGVGVCLKLKKTQPLVVASAVAAGMIGSYAQAVISGIQTSMESGNGFAIALASAGDPMGAFVGAFAAMTLASLVSGRTRVDILITPLVGLAGGALFGIGVGYPVSLALTELGNFIAWAASLSTVSAAVTGLIVSVVMGVALTLPISSAAIGISIGLSGVAAGAAVVGCCCQMMGFAAMSFRENRWGGFVAQGLGTSMLQIPNVFKKPVLFVPPIISSAILGTLSVFLPNGAGIGLFATRTGSGMGTAGLVGPIDMLFEMIGAQGCNVGLTILWVVLFCFVLPALLTLAVCELFRKLNIIKYGDLTLKL
ncbi:MAG TPA: PTS sugar transporter subunit IIC [Candidatus Gallimonas gallistercoris]|uniref:PTS sugar transporter subunit IIC n=1 Tax=Candidatus Gallimonas gallistercoris TaxID=2838602 RepID=A0A9D2H0L3_9FIRM|nr:PTS sugar transporter subunit IIC [Candidatus Gallimonas gallistercoris]